jgi:MerR family transcriptional regulator, light-induced transcriptional regulator
MGQYSIKEVETLSGVKAHTLRVWEQRYAFLRPERTDTNIRYYSDEQLRLLLNVATLNRHGMKISKIAGLNKSDFDNEVLKVYESTSQPDDLLDSLIHAMLDFSEQRFEKTLSAAIIKLGFEDAFVKLVFPFLIRTGVLWATGSVRVVQEHFMSNLIRRKMCAAIDNVYVEPTRKSKKFVLFLPEGETHELLLLFTEYILRKHNHIVTYLGCSLPLNELDFVAKHLKPDFLVTYQTVATEEMPLNNYLKLISATFPSSKILVGGARLSDGPLKLPTNCIPIQSAQDLLNSIA